MINASKLKWKSLVKEQALSHHQQIRLEIIYLSTPLGPCLFHQLVTSLPLPSGVRKSSHLFLRTCSNKLVREFSSLFSFYVKLIFFSLSICFAKHFSLYVEIDVSYKQKIPTLMFNMIMYASSPNLWRWVQITHRLGVSVRTGLSNHN